MAIHIICGALIEREGKILLVQEAKESAKGLWNTPGGGLDFGEDILHGTLREVKEETGLDASLDGLIGIYQQDAHDGIFRIHFRFKVSVISGKINFPKDEIINAKWFAPEEILAMDD